MLKYRRANEDDALIYYKWANDVTVRKQSFNSGEISLENHIEWFKKMVKDKSCIMLIFEDSSRSLIGQVRVKQESEDSFVIGVSVDVNSRGKGFASQMLKDASEYFFKEHPDKKIKAFIKCDNKASVTSFEKAGYGNPVEIIIAGLKSFVYTKENINADSKF